MAVLGCIVTLGASIVAAFIGFTIEIALCILGGVGLVAGPAIAEGGELLEVLGTVVELVADGISSIFEAIGSLFTGW